MRHLFFISCIHTASAEIGALILTATQLLVANTNPVTSLHPWNECRRLLITAWLQWRNWFMTEFHESTFHDDIISRNLELPVQDSEHMLMNWDALTIMWHHSTVNLTPPICGSHGKDELHHSTIMITPWDLTGISTHTIPTPSRWRPISTMITLRHSYCMFLGSITYTIKHR